MKTKAFLPIVTGVFFSTCVYAVPTLQVYIHGDTAGMDSYIPGTCTPDNFNNRYPLRSDVSDPVLYDTGSFSKSTEILDYAADTATANITLEQEKTFAADVPGFDWGHFDMYACTTNAQCKTKLVNAWGINPGSHGAMALRGSSVVPAPGALLLASIGAGVVGWMRKRKAM